MLPLTMSGLAQEVEQFKNDDAGDGLTHVRAGYARVLQGSMPGRNYVHSWSFLRPYGEISLTQGATGTATGAYNSISQTVVTATAPMFGPSNIGDTLDVTLIDLTEATYKWTASGSGTKEYYAEIFAGGDPSLSEPDRVLESWTAMTAGTVGSLSASEWAYDDNDALGYDTVYVRTAGSVDPDDLPDASIYTALDAKTINGYTSTTVVSFADSDAFTADVVRIQSRGVFDLPSGFVGLVNPFEYAYELDETGPRVQQVDPETIQRYRVGSNTASDPRFFAIVPKAEALGAEQTWELWVWPRPDATRIWTYRYMVKPTDVTNEAKNFLGSPLTNQAIRYAALADAEAQMGRKGGYYERLYLEAMTGAVNEDRRMKTRRPYSTAGRGYQFSKAAAVGTPGYWR